MMPYDGAETGRYAGMACPFAMRQRTIERDALVCSWSCSSLAPRLSRPAHPRHRRRSRRRAAPWRHRRPSIPETGLPVTTTADGRFEITAAAPGWRRLTITLRGFPLIRCEDVRAGARHGERCARRTADHASAAGARRDRQRDRHPRQRAAGRGGARFRGHTRRPAARGVTCARRCAAERAGVQSVSSDLVAHGEPDGAGRIPAGCVGIRCEPCAGAGRWRAAQRPVRRMGLLGPRAAGGDRACRGRARRRERPVRRRCALGCRAGV